MNPVKSMGLRLRDLRSDAPQDLAAERRSAERRRRAILTGATASVARAVRVGVYLITVPLTLHYLGSEQFGLWMAISSVLAMASFADFGIGNGVLNTVADASGKNDLVALRRAISSGFAVLTFIAATLLFTFFYTYRFVSWANLFGVTTAGARMEAGRAMVVFAVCFAANLPLDIVQRVQLGLQEGFRTNLWQLCSSIMAFVGVLAGIHLRLGLHWLVAAYAGAPVLGTAMNMLYFFGISRRDLLPQFRFVSRSTISRIAKLGGLFFVLQVVAAISSSADNLIVARTLGAVEVAVFSIPQRMFAVIPLAAVTLLEPLWPAYGEAVSRGDMHWVRRTLANTLLTVLLLTSAASVTLLILAKPLMRWWVGPQFHAPLMLLVGLAAWTVLTCCGTTVGFFFSGASVLRFQLIIYSSFGVVCLPLKILLTRHFGVIGVPWSTVIAHALIIVLPSLFYVPYVLNHMERREIKINATPSDCETCTEII